MEQATKKDRFLAWFFNNISPTDIVAFTFFFSTFIWLFFPIDPVGDDHYNFILQMLIWLGIHLIPVLGYAFFLNRWEFLFKPIYKFSVFIAPTFIYLKLYYIIPSVNNNNFDLLLYKIDKFLLGDDASRILERLFWNHSFIEVMAFFYIFYFVLIYLPIVKKFFTKNVLFDTYVTGFGLTMMLGFFINIIVPSLGPKFFFSSDFYQYDLVGSTFMNACDAMIENLSGGYQAFPSLHFGAPCFVLFFDFFHSRRRFYLYLIPTIMVWTSAIFLRYHYITDHIGGLMLVIFSLWFTPKFMRWYTKKADYFQNKVGKTYKRSYYFPLDYSLTNKKYSSKEIF